MCFGYSTCFRIHTHISYCIKWLGREPSQPSIMGQNVKEIFSLSLKFRCRLSLFCTEKYWWYDAFQKGNSFLGSHHFLGEKWKKATRNRGFSGESQFQDCLHLPWPSLDDGLFTYRANVKGKGTLLDRKCMYCTQSKFSVLKYSFLGL